MASSADVLPTDPLFSNFETPVSSHFLTVLNSSEYLKREIQSVDSSFSGDVHITLGPASTIDSSVTADASNPILRLGKGLFPGGETQDAQDYVACVVLAHELTHVLDNADLYFNENLSPGSDLSGAVATMIHFDDSNLLSEGIAMASQIIVAQELLNAQPTLERDDSGDTITKAQAQFNLIAPADVLTYYQQSVSAFDNSKSSSNTSSLDITGIVKGKYKSIRSAELAAWIGTKAGSFIDGSDYPYSARIANNSVTYMPGVNKQNALDHLNDRVNSDFSTMVTNLFTYNYKLTVKAGALYGDVSAVVFDLREAIPQGNVGTLYYNSSGPFELGSAGGILFTPGSATYYRFVQHQLPSFVSVAQSENVTEIDPTASSPTYFLPPISESPDANAPSFELGSIDGTNDYLSKTDLVGSFSIKQILELPESSGVRQYAFEFGKTGPDGNIDPTNAWAAPLSDVSSDTIIDDSSGSLTAQIQLKSGDIVDYGSSDGYKLTFSGYSAVEIGHLLQGQQDDITDPVLGDVSQVTLPDGTPFYKTGTEVFTPANQQWLIANDGAENITQTASDLISGDDIAWLKDQSGGDTSNVSIISLVGLSKGSEPIEVATVDTTSPKSLVVLGNSDAFLIADGDDTVVGGLGSVSLEDWTPNQDLQFWGGDGNANILANGPEDLHLGLGSSHIYFGGGLYPLFDPSTLHVSGFDPTKDIIVPSGENLDQLATGMVANAANWLQFADDGQTHSPWQAFGYSNFQQDPNTGEMTVTGGAQANYVQGGREDLVVNEPGGNNTVLAGAGNTTVTAGDGHSLIDFSKEGYASTDTVTSEGTNTIVGGPGTLVASVSGGYAETDGQGNATLILGPAGTLVDSEGRDQINASTGNDSINVYGTTTVNGSTGLSSFDLEGAGNILNSKGADTITVGSRASASISGAGPLMLINEYSYAATSITDTYQGITAALTVTGASTLSSQRSATATQISVAAGNMSLSTGSNNEQITFNTGKATVSSAVSGVSITEGAATALLINDSGANTVIQGGAAGFTLAGASSMGGDTITTASGSTSAVTLGLGADTINSNGTDTINVGAATATVTATGSVTVTQTTGTTMIQENGTTTQSSATVVGGLATITGAANLNGLVINTSASGVGTQITLGKGNDSVTTFGPTTIVGGSGLMVFTGHANAIVTDGPGGEQVQMGSGNAIFTTVAGTHNTLNLGSNNQQIFSAGNDNIYAGSGNVTVSGGAGTVLMYASIGGLTFLGGAGSSTIHGKASGGGAMSITGGAGALTVTGSSGNDTLIGGAGNVNLTEGNGTDNMQFGAGAATVAGGTGADLYTLVKEASTGVGTISGFKVGPDHLHLVNYNASEAQNAIASATVSGGNTMLAFTGGEHLTLKGVTGLTAASFS